MFFDHMYLRELTPGSIKMTMEVTNEMECAEACIQDRTPEGCLAFDLYFQGPDSYECRLASSNFTTVETEDFDVYLLHFEIEKFACKYHR